MNWNRFRFKQFEIKQPICLVQHCNYNLLTLLLFWENSPKGEELTGFLHGHPVTDETGDQTGGETEDKKVDDSEKSSSDRQTDKDEQQSVKTKKRQVRSSSLLLYHRHTIDFTWAQIVHELSRLMFHCNVLPSTVPQQRWFYDTEQPQVTLLKPRRSKCSGIMSNIQSGLTWRGQRWWGKCRRLKLKWQNRGNE